MASLTKKLLYTGMFMAMVLFLAACGGSGEDELTLLNENFEEVSITGKEQPTVFFHFTSVG